MAKSKAKAGSLNVDFSNTDESGSRIPAGDYIVKVTKAEVKDGKEFPYINWTLEIISGEFKGKKIFHNTTLAPHALFSLRNLLSAIGIEVPKGKLSLKLKEYIGKILGVYVEDGEFKNDKGRKQKKSEVIEMYAVEKQGKKWIKIMDEDEEEEEDDDSDDDGDDDDDSDDDDEDEDEDEDEDDDSDDDDSDDDEEDDDSDDDDDDDSDDDDSDDDDDDLDEELEEILKKGAAKAGKGKGKEKVKEEPAKKGKGKKAAEPEPEVKKGKGKAKK